MLEWTRAKKTIILFSGEFDKVMAALIIANGAAAMGDDVTIFCTFWGLNILRKREKVEATGTKSTLQTMFGKMMPRGTKRLGLSKMNFAGAGEPLMRKVMKDAERACRSRSSSRAPASRTSSSSPAPCRWTSSASRRTSSSTASSTRAWPPTSGKADEANVNLFI